MVRGYDPNMQGHEEAWGEEEECTPKRTYARSLARITNKEIEEIDRSLKAKKVIGYIMVFGPIVVLVGCLVITLYAIDPRVLFFVLLGLGVPMLIATSIVKGFELIDG